MNATHASFFSGVGGLDLGLERAGWRTVSFSEIDPYASAVLAERWPGVPNLGDITRLGGSLGCDERTGRDGEGERTGRGDGAARRRDHVQPDGFGAWHSATLWSGGFPCQDLSVAGKRAGMGSGTRSGLAFAFLDLVERYRPPAITLENVPGLLSSHGGRDMAALLGRMVQLGYGVAYRTLDAQFFGVPQRRRRVFILGLRSDPNDTDGHLAAERAASVLSVGARCARHPATGQQEGPEPPTGAGSGVGHTLSTRPGGRLSAEDDYIADTLRVGGRDQGAGNSYDNTPWTVAASLRASDGHHGHSSPRGYGQDNLITGPIRSHVRPGSNSLSGSILSTSSDSDRMREATGLAGRLDRVYNPYRTLNPDGTITSGYAEREVTDALHLATGNKEPLIIGDGPADGPDPLGLDSHRYRCCGNGVVSDVSEWIGRQLIAALETA